MKSFKRLQGLHADFSVSSIVQVILMGNRERVKALTSLLREGLIIILLLLLVFKLSINSAGSYLDYYLFCYSL